MKNQEQKTVIIPFRVTPAEKEKIEEMSYGHYKLMAISSENVSSKKILLSSTELTKLPMSFAVSETM